jgi:hypothetical protein
VNATGEALTNRLVIGVEPLDAVAGGRVPLGVRVEVDGTPFPGGVGDARLWFLKSDALAEIPRHATGVHAQIARAPSSRPLPATMALRIFDRERRYVPRRLSVPLDPAGGTMVRPLLYPGAAVDVSYTATGLRGRLLRASGAPVRWARVDVRIPGRTTPLGVAHGDDRGEFVLLLPPEAAGARRSSRTRSASRPIRSTTCPSRRTPRAPLPPLNIRSAPSPPQPATRRGARFESCTSPLESSPRVSRRFSCSSRPPRAERAKRRSL